MASGRGVQRLRCRNVARHQWAGRRGAQTVAAGAASHLPVLCIGRLHSAAALSVNLEWVESGSALAPPSWGGSHLEPNGVHLISSVSDPGDAAAAQPLRVHGPHLRHPAAPGVRLSQEQSAEGKGALRARPSPFMEGGAWNCFSGCWAPIPQPMPGFQGAAAS